VGGRVLLTFATAAILSAGCGEDDFANEARAPIRLELSGVVQPDRVTVSPSRDLGAGPFEITLSNQTEDAHTITLEGESIVEKAGSVEPGDTVTIRRTLDPGSYELRAGSEQAVRKEIEPAVLEIGSERENSNSDLLLP
jgi:hypothetical protein